jgi:hypothetical protein
VKQAFSPPALSPARTRAERAWREMAGAAAAADEPARRRSSCIPARGPHRAGRIKAWRAW